MNFKRHISVFLALFILLVNSSASLVLHYCHDQIASISLIYQENKFSKIFTQSRRSGDEAHYLMLTHLR